MAGWTWMRSWPRLTSCSRSRPPLTGRRSSAGGRPRRRLRRPGLRGGAVRVQRQAERPALPAHVRRGAARRSGSSSTLTSTWCRPSRTSSAAAGRRSALRPRRPGHEGVRAVAGRAFRELAPTLPYPARAAARRRRGGRREHGTAHQLEQGVTGEFVIIGEHSGLDIVADSKGLAHATAAGGRARPVMAPTRGSATTPWSS